MILPCFSVSIFLAPACSAAYDSCAVFITIPEHCSSNPSGLWSASAACADYPVLFLIDWVDKLSLPEDCSWRPAPARVFTLGRIAFMCDNDLSYIMKAVVLNCANKCMLLLIRPKVNHQA